MICIKRMIRWVMNKAGLDWKDYGWNTCHVSKQVTMLPPDEVAHGIEEILSCQSSSKGGKMLWNRPAEVPRSC